MKGILPERVFSTVLSAEAYMDRMIEKLQTIKELWVSLRKTKPDSLEYVALLKRIRRLSTEYQALAGAKDNPNDPR